MIQKTQAQKLVLFTMFLLYICFQLQGELKIIENSLDKIDISRDKIKLIPVRVWGEDDTEDINQVFRFPSDVQINTKNQVFILDSANHRIQVFDESRKFIRTISQKGEGPGDTMMPGKMALTKSNDIVIADLFNFRIQVLDPVGKYIHSFRTGESMPSNFALSPKDEVLLYLPKKNDECKWGVSLFDLKGNLLNDICTFPCIAGTNAKEPLFSLVDNKGNIVIAYLRVPLFQRFSSNGKLLMTTSFEPPVKASTFRLPHGSPVPVISVNKDKKGHPVLAACNVDGSGRMFLVVYNRPRQKQDKFYMTGIGQRMPKEFPEKTDLFRLFVFDSKGKIIASKILSVYCDHICIYGNRLFIIDTYRLMKIHEYRFEI